MHYGSGKNFFSFDADPEIVFCFLNIVRHNLYWCLKRIIKTDTFRGVIFKTVWNLVWIQKSGSSELKCGELGGGMCSTEWHCWIQHKRTNKSKHTWARCCLVQCWSRMGMTGRWWGCCHGNYRLGGGHRLWWRLYYPYWECGTSDSCPCCSKQEIWQEHTGWERGNIRT